MATCTTVHIIKFSLIRYCDLFVYQRIEMVGMHLKLANNNSLNSDIIFIRSKHNLCLRGLSQTCSYIYILIYSLLYQASC